MIRTLMSVTAMIVLLAFSCANQTEANATAQPTASDSRPGDTQTSSPYKSITIGIPVSNLEESQKWIYSVLGDLERMVPAEGVVEFQLSPNTWLQLFEMETINNQSVVRLEVSDIESEYKRLQDLGIKLSELQIVPDVVSVFEFEDQDGNAFSLYQLLQ